MDFKGCLSLLGRILSELDNFELRFDDQLFAWAAVLRGCYYLGTLQLAL